MKQLIFIGISLFIYLGAFTLGEKIFGDSDLAVLFGAVAGGICFWWLVSKADKLE